MKQFLLYALVCVQLLVGCEKQGAYLYWGPKTELSADAQMVYFTPSVITTIEFEEITYYYLPENIDAPFDENTIKVFNSNIYECEWFRIEILDDSRIQLDIYKNDSKLKREIHIRLKDSYSEGGWSQIDVIQLGLENY